MIGQVSIPFATAVVGYDLFSQEKWNIASQPRVLNGIAVTGSAAAGDCEVELYVGMRLVTNIFNTALGFATRDHVQPLVGNFVPPGTKISCIVKTAPGTNPLQVVLY
ncbi:unnamed protein product [marine sediment metagenome]|uniref:Uncharacterized protein n=1 Tax=marine sediment metagenome TaxID=412755 RepID=X1MAD0_9ZZZZ